MCFMWEPCMRNFLCVLLREYFTFSVVMFLDSFTSFLHRVSMVKLFASFLACYIVAEWSCCGNICIIRYCYRVSTRAHSTRICTCRPQVATKKKKGGKLSPTKPNGAIPDDVLKRAKELAGDHQKLYQLLRKKAFREVGDS